jgi:hypothetical protein
MGVQKIASKIECLPLVLGSVLSGLVGSVVPVEIGVFALPLLLLIGPLKRWSWPKRLSALAMMLGTVFVCWHLPVKQLDRMVGPAEYASMSLKELTERLRLDHGIHVSTFDPEAKTQVLSFSIPHRMSRRRVLEKLANDSGWTLQIGYCGTGATILFGSSPSFTTLYPPEPATDFAIPQQSRDQDTTSQ